VPYSICSSAKGQKNKNFMAKIFGSVFLALLVLVSVVIVAPQDVFAAEEIGQSTPSASAQALSPEDAVSLKQTLDAVQATLLLLDKRIGAGVTAEESQLFVAVLDGLHEGLVAVSRITLALEMPASVAPMYVADTSPGARSQVSVEDIVRSGVGKDEVASFDISDAQTATVVTVRGAASLKKVIAIAIVLAFVVGVFLFRRGTKEAIIGSKIVSKSPSSS